MIHRLPARRLSALWKRGRRSPEFRQDVLDTIENTALGILKDETTMIVSRLKVVPIPAATLFRA
jgi:hypothetical protein